MRKQKFRRKVQIQSTVGRYLYSAHRDLAQALVRVGDAYAPDKEGQVWRIILLNAPVVHAQPVAPSAYPLYSLSKGQKTTYLQHLTNPGHRLYQFRRLYAYDQDGLLRLMTSNRTIRVSEQ